MRPRLTLVVPVAIALGSAYGAMQAVGRYTTTGDLGHVTAAIAFSLVALMAVKRASRALAS